MHDGSMVQKSCTEYWMRWNTSHETRHKKVKHEQFQKDRSQNSNTSVEDGNGNDVDVPADRDDPLNDATFVDDQVRVPIDDATFVIT